MPHPTQVTLDFFLVLLLCWLAGMTRNGTPFGCASWLQCYICTMSSPEHPSGTTGRPPPTLVNIISAKRGVRPATRFSEEAASCNSSRRVLQAGLRVLQHIFPREPPSCKSSRRVLQTGFRVLQHIFPRDPPSCTSSRRVLQTVSWRKSCRTNIGRILGRAKNKSRTNSGRIC